MNPSTARDRSVAWDATALLTRWALGLLFIYMGLNKALHPFDFLKLVREYDLVSSAFVLNAIAAALPWFEIYCGVLLVLGIAVRGSALLLLLMLIPFTLVVLQRALAIAHAEGKPFCTIKFDCGCGNGEVLICRKLIENSLLILLSIWLIFTAHGRRCTLWFGLDRPQPGEPTLDHPVAQPQNRA